MRISLRTRWTFVLLLLGALPVALLASYGLRTLKKGLEDSERALGLATIDQAADGIERMFGEVAETSHRTGKLLQLEGIADPDLRIALARDTIAAAPAVAQVAIYDGAGQLVDAIGKPGAAAAPPPANLSPETREASTREGGWTTSDGEFGLDREKYIERMGQADRAGGYLVGGIDPGVLAASIGNLSKLRFNDPRRILLLDSDFRVLAGGDARYESPGKQVSPGAIFATASIPQNAFSVGFALTAEYRAPDGEEMVATVRTLPDRGWAIIVRRPRGEAYAALEAARNGLLGTTAGFVVFLLGMGLWLGHRNTAPVKSLVTLTRAYAKRDFATRSPVHSGDELEHLGHAMEGMADTLRASESEILRRTQVEANLARFMPAAVAESIAKGDSELRLGGERRMVTVLFADVVSFTPFAEASPPERVVAFLNQLFSTLTEVVFRHHGIVDKFIGDCLMAVFGAPAHQADHVARAVAAAEDMQRFVEAQAPAWKRDFGIEVRLGIGVNTGEVVVGNLGSEARMEYTAIGDTVNVASRLEAMARPGQTLVTSEVATHAGPGFRFAPLGDVELRGKRKGVTVLELQ